MLAYQDLLFRQAVWTLCEPEAAEDVTQETFLRAYRSLCSFRDGDFRCWLQKIARRLCQEELRRGKSGHSSPWKADNYAGVKVNTVFRVIDRAESLEGNTSQNELVKIVQEGLK